ncbi:hypothetical protein OEZ85_010488 [Tetradesmus obliquus]|uniref:SET domain-containing protein n=1 Tax=Tetradesmus obliquus TaxID=3088 RepID=A0ABY8TN16_TETOB|nr:hypothetical protein OEZ85_010488 [Tetradesmus obliquus]
MGDTEPVLPPLTNRTTVKDHSSYGRSAFASENIKRGELVICEEPLLSFNATADSKVVIGLMKQLQAYLEAHRELLPEASMIHQDDWASTLNFYLAYCKADEATQQLVLQEMFNTPGGDDVASASPLRRTAVEAQAFAGMAPEITKVLKIFAAVAASSSGAAAAAEVKPASDDPQLVQRVLLASELNVHSMGGGGAMYKAGSKLAHTCDTPNTYYLSYKGRGCHIALRDIAAGELLTTTYLVPEVQLLSVFGRKRYLWDAFAFDCACQRCTSQIDKLSAYPCNRCATPAVARSKDGLLPNLMPGLNYQAPASSSSSSAADGASSSSSSGGAEVPGLLLFDPRKADPAVMRTHYVAAKEEPSCCGCDHDHGDGHNHHHHHHHGHDHSPNGHSHKHEHKATGAAAAGAAAAGAGATEGGEEAAAAAAAAAGPACWQCNKCGLQLPDRDLDIVGDYEAVRDAQVRFERWAYNAALHFDPQGEHADKELAKVRVLLGPYHWALHFIFMRQNDLFTSIVRSVGMQLAQTGKLPAQYLHYLVNAVAGLQLNVNATWAWLTGPAGMAVPAAAAIMAPMLMRASMSLADTASELLRNPRYAASQAELLHRMQDLAADLLAKAEPGLERYEAWPLPEQHPLLRMLAQVRARAAKTAEMVPAAGGGAGGLNMDQLLDFLPASGGGGGSGGKAAAGKAAAAGAAAAGGAGKAKGKKKAGGKK